MIDTLETPTATAGGETSWPELGAGDRCEGRVTGLDSVVSTCNAQALVRWVTPAALELVFCGHHSNAYAPGLTAQGAKIVTDMRTAD